jgi:hypothetical protein
VVNHKGLRSGKEVDNHVEEKKDEQTRAPQNLQSEKGKQASTKASSSSAPTLEIPYEPRVPFPECLKARSHFGKQGENIQDMMEIFKQVKINIPLLDVIKQILAYSNFSRTCAFRRGRTRNIFLREAFSLSK